jgi:hypothetical protein
MPKDHDGRHRHHDGGLSHDDRGPGHDDCRERHDDREGPRGPSTPVAASPDPGASARVASALLSI